jgi:hypothetical protein
MTPAARAGPAVRVGPFPRRRFLVDDAGQDVGRALRPTRGWSVERERSNSVRTSRAGGYEPGGLPRGNANAPPGRS